MDENKRTDTMRKRVTARYYTVDCVTKGCAKSQACKQPLKVRNEGMKSPLELLKAIQTDLTTILGLLTFRIKLE